jgi:hypothetical protein
MALLMLRLEWVLDEKRPTEPEKLVRGAQETDDAWKARESAYVAAESEYQLQSRRWDLDNKKCLVICRLRRLSLLRHPFLKRMEMEMITLLENIWR